MGEEEMDILESICGLHRHQNAAQTVRSKRNSYCMDEQIPDCCSKRITFLWLSLAESRTRKPRCFHPCRECAHWRLSPGAYSDRDIPAPAPDHPKPVWHKPPRAPSMLPYMNNLLGVFDGVIIALLYK